jgi:hypothetical protein
MATEWQPRYHLARWMGLKKALENLARTAVMQEFVVDLTEGTLLRQDRRSGNKQLENFVVLEEWHDHRQSQAAIAKKIQAFLFVPLSWQSFV